MESRRLSLATTLASAKRTSLNQVLPRPVTEERTGATPPKPAATHAGPIAQPAEFLQVTRKSGRNGAIEMIRKLDPNDRGTGDDGNTEFESAPFEPVIPKAESPVSHFREFHQNIPHPAAVLNLVAEEQDREVFSVFDELCNELLSALGDFEASLEEITIWKDDFLTQSVPSNVKLQLVLLFSRLFRSKSELHEPLFELIKQVRLYSRPWTNKRFALLELEKDYQRQSHVLDVSIRKLEQLQAQMSKIKSDRRVALWEKLARRMLKCFIDFDDEEAVAALDSADAQVKQHSEVNQNDSFRGRSESVDNRSQSNMLHPSNAAAIRREQSVSYERERSKSRRRNGPKHSRRTTGNSVLIHDDELTSHEKDTGEIRAYIAQSDPSWVKKAKTLVASFETLLSRTFPRHRTKLVRLHRRPFPRPLNLSYVTKKTGTLFLRRPLYPNMPRSWSLIDLQKIKPQEGRQPWGELKSTLTSVNSYNALNELMHSELRQKIEPHMDMKPVKFDIRKIIETDSQSEYSSDDSSAPDDKDDEFSDFEYFNDVDPDALEDTIGKFTDPNRSNSRDQFDENAFIESRKGWFSLQDVMELTLLHAQQMQLMQSEYEERLSQLESLTAETKKAHEEMQNDYESKLKQANERAQRILKECMKNAAEGLGTAVEGSEMSSNESEVEDDEVSTIAAAKTKLKGGKRSNMSSREYAHVIPQHHSHIRRREYVLKKKPKFTSAPFTMSFLERLRWFTEEKLKNKTHIREKFMALEIAANEEKLQQLKLIKRDPGAPVLDAEFLPFPGHVPPPRHRPPWAEHVMPWGGRFHSSQVDNEKHEHNINVLNLFDVAVNMKKVDK